LQKLLPLVPISKPSPQPAGAGRAGTWEGRSRGGVGRRAGRRESAREGGKSGCIRGSGSLCQASPEQLMAPGAEEKVPKAQTLHWELPGRLE